MDNVVGTTEARPSPVSKRLIFEAALVGALLPRLLGFIDDRTVRLPGEDWPHTLGWLLVALGLALAAGWVTANVWREEDTRRAFALGLGFLYVVNGGANDVQNVAKSFAPRPARGEQLAQFAAQTGQGTIEITVKAPHDPTRTVTLLVKPVSAGGEASTEAIRRIETNAFPVRLYAPPGRYLIQASAPSLMGSKHIVVTAGHTEVAQVELHRDSAARQFFEGMKGAVFGR
jgi:hypothetical protein